MANRRPHRWNIRAGETTAGRDTSEGGPREQAARIREALQLISGAVPTEAPEGYQSPDTTG